MKRRFACNCELKIGRSEDFVTLEMRGTHDRSSHAPDKDQSKFLKLAQIDAIRQGVRMAPKQTAKHLRRNLQQCSPDKRIDPKLLPCIRRKVRKFRKELTGELLDGLKMDDSFGALNQFVQERWFTTLLEKHNDPDSDYHFNLFDVVIIGQDLNVEDDIVYMNMSSLWFLLNFVRNIAAGWLTQLNGDVTFKVNRRGVAALSLGVNSVGHVNNPICWAVIPETTEGQVTYTGTWHSVRDAIILLLRTYRTCDGCEACDAVKDLRDSQKVARFMRSDEYKAGKLIVDATLCDHEGGFWKFTHEEFGFDPNTCTNHATGIGASNYTHRKYFLTQVSTTTVFEFFVLHAIYTCVVPRKTTTSGMTALFAWAASALIRSATRPTY